MGYYDYNLGQPWLGAFGQNAEESDRKLLAQGQADNAALAAGQPTRNETAFGNWIAENNKNTARIDEWTNTMTTSGFPGATTFKPRGNTGTYAPAQVNNWRDLPFSGEQYDWLGNTPRQNLQTAYTQNAAMRYGGGKVGPAAYAQQNPITNWGAMTSPFDQVVAYVAQTLGDSSIFRRDPEAVRRFEAAQDRFMNTTYGPGGGVQAAAQALTAEGIPVIQQGPAWGAVTQGQNPTTMREYQPVSVGSWRLANQALNSLPQIQEQATRDAILRNPGRGADYYAGDERVRNRALEETPGWTELQGIANARQPGGDYDVSGSGMDVFEGSAPSLSMGPLANSGAAWNAMVNGAISNGLDERDRGAFGEFMRGYLSGDGYDRGRSLGENIGDAIDLFGQARAHGVSVGSGTPQEQLQIFSQYDTLQANPGGSNPAFTLPTVPTPLQQQLNANEAYLPPTLVNPGRASGKVQVARGGATRTPARSTPTGFGVPVVSKRYPSKVPLTGPGGANRNVPETRKPSETQGPSRRPTTRKRAGR